jgi:hypothetical protein
MSSNVVVGEKFSTYKRLVEVDTETERWQTDVQLLHDESKRKVQLIKKCGKVKLVLDKDENSKRDPKAKCNIILRQYEKSCFYRIVYPSARTLHRHTVIRIAADHDSLKTRFTVRVNLAIEFDHRKHATLAELILKEFILIEASPTQQPEWASELYDTSAGSRQELKNNFKAQIFGRLNIIDDSSAL